MSMRTGIEQWLLKIWYSRAQPPWYLRMLVPLYRSGFSFDHRASRVKVASTAGAAPVVVVGNITVGGSGKTPLVVTLTRLAQDMQLSVGIASTGYGRKSSETFLVHPHSDPRLCGDEPVLLSIRTGAVVVVAKRRATAVAELNRMGVNLIISDDGLQTAGFQRDLEICVLDGDRGLGNGYLLPAGPLREPRERLAEADCIISNGQWSAQASPIAAHVMTLAGTALVSLDGSQSMTVADFFKQERGNDVHVVAGIGNPERFFDAMRKMDLPSGLQVSATVAWHQHQFPDHHDYQRSDFEGFGGAIVMTEKDAVKCHKLGLENAWYLPVDAELSEAFEHWFRQQLARLTME